MRHYLKNVKLCGTQTGIYPRFLGQKICQTPVTKLSANQAPKWNHTAGTFAPQPMPGWHLKVPATHLDKPLGRSVEGLELFPVEGTCHTTGKYGGVTSLVQLTIDENTQLIFLADYAIKRVQVVSFERKFIDKIGEDNLENPWSIAALMSTSLVVDNGHNRVSDMSNSSLTLVLYS